MRPHRSRGRAYARRLIHILCAAVLGVPAMAAAAGVTGIVVDPDGRPLPHAHVRIVDGVAGAGEEAFTDGSGRFTLPGDTGCLLEASLSGFRATRVSCAEGEVTIQLPLAPIEESVVVTATRTETTAGRTGVSVTTFSADDIARRQTPPVSELLRTSAGAMVLQTGGTGGVTGLFVRGGESNYNLVLVDGIPMNDPGGTFNFNTLTTENVERVEIVRGANSALFGSDAMSSVVQIFTRRAPSSPEGRPSVGAQIDGGSYGTWHASTSVAGATNRFDYSLGAARYSTDNRVPNSGFDNTTLSANVGAAAGSASVRAVVRAELGKNGTPGQTAYGRPDLDAFYEHHDVVGGLTFDQDLAHGFHQRASYSLSSSHQSSTNLLEDPAYTPAYDGRTAPFAFSDFTFDSLNVYRRHHASYQADLRLSSGGTGDQRLTLLADWNGERARLLDRLAGDETRPSRDNVGASVQHQLLWRRLSTTAGLRFEHNGSFGGAVAPRGSLALALREAGGAVGDTRLHAAAGLGIKEPTVLQSFSTSPYFRGNPDLEPERSRAVETGVEQRFAADRVRLDATWFDNRYRNIIGLRPDGGFTYSYFNIGLTRARGAEITADLVPHASVHVRGGYTFVDSKILESASEGDTVFAAGNRAFRRPRHSGFIQSSVTLGALTATVGGTMIGPYVDSDFSSLVPALTGNPGRTLWDAKLSYRLQRALTALLAIDNLTGRDYQEPLGYPALQRAVRVGLRVGL